METNIRNCVGCGVEFLAMEIGGFSSYYCTSDCKENHSIFKESLASKDTE